MRLKHSLGIIALLCMTGCGGGFSNYGYGSYQAAIIVPNNNPDIPVMESPYAPFLRYPYNGSVEVQQNWSQWFYDRAQREHIAHMQITALEGMQPSP